MIHHACYTQSCILPSTRHTYNYVYSYRYQKILTYVRMYSNDSLIHSPTVYHMHITACSIIIFLSHCMGGSIKLLGDIYLSYHLVDVTLLFLTRLALECATVDNTNNAKLPMHTFAWNCLHTKHFTLYTL